MLHTVAYSFSAGLPGTATTTLSIVADPFFAAAGPGAFLTPRHVRLVAAYAIGQGLTRARVLAPSLLRVGFPYIRPIESAANNLPPTNPNFMVLRRKQLRIPAGEAIGIEVASAGFDAATIFALLWFVEDRERGPKGTTRAAPAGDASASVPLEDEGYWLRYTAAENSVTPFAWSPITPLFDQTIPSGTYAVVGFEHTGPTAVAARLNFPGHPYRPGVVAQTSVSGRTADPFYDSTFGVYGTFRTLALPSVEVLASGNDVPSSSHEGYMQVIRLGGLGATTHGPGRC
jgi:hypothetical protein